MFLAEQSLDSPAFADSQHKRFVIPDSIRDPATFALLQKKKLDPGSGDGVTELEQ